MLCSELSSASVNRLRTRLPLPRTTDRSAAVPMGTCIVGDKHHSKSWFASRAAIEVHALKRPSSGTRQKSPNLPNSAKQNSNCDYNRSSSPLPSCFLLFNIHYVQKVHWRLLSYSKVSNGSEMFD
ncbi:uncharacterized protein UTRI_02925 [Ustilago trichophora]|uniref:Uncharacterized protein n=1 Tax=Ustilago trichophora TaxID=86804 RepID=A0A5C3EP99_9BASI|nr:uncharacterized protein UTRI_02925 [Ustilago trichophora]